MVSCGKQFLLLLWKNALLQRRKPKTTVFQILLPTIFGILLVVIRQNVEAQAYTDPRDWPSFNVEEPWLKLGSIEEMQQISLAYTPDIPVVQRIMQRVQEKMGFNTTSEYA